MRSKEQMSNEWAWVKLFLAAAIAGLSALLLAVTNDGEISLAEWIAVALAVFSALAGTEAYVQRSRAKRAEAEVAALEMRAVKDET